MVKQEHEFVCDECLVTFAIVIEPGKPEAFCQSQDHQEFEDALLEGVECPKCGKMLEATE